MDHFFVLNHHVENIQADSQSNDIDPKVNDENGWERELYEHESEELIHCVELNFLNPFVFKLEKKRTFYEEKKSIIYLLWLAIQLLV